MTEKKMIEIFIKPAQQGTYLTLPFDLPPGTAALHLAYTYDRHRHNASPAGGGTFTAREEINIIDLGLIAPDGTQAGASGSDKRAITISAAWATPGYKPQPLIPGRWQILVGAYKVADPGVRVTYELSFEPKTRRLLKGDLHTHTLASDGVLTAEELGRHALRNGLDFIAVTDHNTLTPTAALKLKRHQAASAQCRTHQCAAQALSLPRIEGLTFIPGVEWSHYRGHANFLGIDQPFDGPYAAPDGADPLAVVHTARERGALITLNHPFEEACPFTFDLAAVPFDVLEVWNGPMRESNLRALGLWAQLLASGQKVPICGGSDYHRDRLFQILGGPTTCVFTESASPADILTAVRAGHSFITFAPEGPTLKMSCGEAILGESLPYQPGQMVEIALEGLEQGDVVRLVTPDGSTDLFTAPAPGAFETQHPVTGPGFVRLEVWRTFLPGVPALPALLANPIYFDA